MGIPIYHIDAFTDKRFSGNPAGVCLLPVPADAGWMQNVAREMNMSETAFLYQQEDGFNLRWFTPAVEVELCGHATLASAHVLWTEGYLPAGEPARFHTLSGLLTAHQAGDWIELDFPATPVEPVTPPNDLLKALSIQPKYVGQSQFDYLVEVGIEETVRAMQPDFGLLKQVSTRGVIVTSPARSPDYDFISRFFAPAVGVNEDPVTGSAHCCLGPFWGRRFGKRELVGYQASPRGGTVRVRIEGERVILGGQAVTILRGELI
ncbi:MAG: PhzF family phenazine biosynthesis protein [Anaerolineae bacterium]